MTVDAEDYDRASAIAWWCQRKPSGAKYAHRMFTENGKRYVVRLARFILGDVPADKFVDHINGDGLDNRKANLRIVDNRSNLRGFQRKPTGRATSIYRGVCWSKNRNKWLAQIGARNIDRKDSYIGYFESEIDAARAFNKRAAEFGYLPEALNAV